MVFFRRSFMTWETMGESVLSEALYLFIFLMFSIIGEFLFMRALVRPSWTVFLKETPISRITLYYGFRSSSSERTPNSASDTTGYCWCCSTRSNDGCSSCCCSGGFRCRRGYACYNSRNCYPKDSTMYRVPNPIKPTYPGLYHAIFANFVQYVKKRVPREHWKIYPPYVER